MLSRKRNMLFAVLALSIMMILTAVPVMAATTMGTISVVSGSATDAEKGSAITFSVDVWDDEGDNSVTWAVSGNTSGSTYMYDSTLYIGADEFADNLVVSAVANADPVQMQVFPVSVHQEDPYAPVYPDYVSLSGPATMSPGESAYLNPYASGGANVTFSYSLSGNTDPNTYISNDSIYVGANEQAQALTVTYYCDQASGINSTIYIGVYQPPQASIAITYAPDSVMVGESAAVTVYAENTPSVSWSVAGNTSYQTMMTSSGMLIVGTDEASSAITVTAVASSDPAVSDSVTIAILPKPEEPTEPEVIMPETVPEPPTEIPTEWPPEQPTQRPEPPTEWPTERPTEWPTEPSTPAPTQPEQPTNPPTQPVTQPTTPTQPQTPTQPVPVTPTQPAGTPVDVTRPTQTDPAAQPGQTQDPSSDTNTPQNPGSEKKTFEETVSDSMGNLRSGLVERVVNASSQRQAENAQKLAEAESRAAAEKAEADAKAAAEKAERESRIAAEKAKADAAKEQESSSEEMGTDDSGMEVKENSPKTGDTNHVFLYAMIGSAALACLVGAYLVLVRKKKEDR